jgi:serine O-acetyltransferase
MTLMGDFRTIRAAWAAVGDDQAVMAAVGGESFRARPKVQALIAEPGLRAAFLMRVISGNSTRLTAIIARSMLIRNFGCDISRRARILGGVYMPHPIGIVIGKGVQIHGGVRIYQHVTLGAGGGGYPTLLSGATVFAGATIAGSLTVGRGAMVSAGSLVTADLPDGAVSLRSPGMTHLRHSK